TYLGRHDLAHVAPDDLRGDALHDEDDEPASPPAPPAAAGDAAPAARPAAAGGERPAAAGEEGPFATPRGGQLNPRPGNGHGSNGNGHGKNGNGAGGRLALAQDEKVRVARLKGYEGDPCPECGQLTLVRSGACAKCDTCGATSGCS